MRVGEENSMQLRVTRDLPAVILLSLGILGAAVPDPPGDEGIRGPDLAINQQSLVRGDRRHARGCP